MELHTEHTVSAQAVWLVGHYNHFDLRPYKQLWQDIFFYYMLIHLLCNAYYNYMAICLAYVFSHFLLASKSDVIPESLFKLEN